jgi:O-antigen/teichoic acid export membrane protein
MPRFDWQLKRFLRHAKISSSRTLVGSAWAVFGRFAVQIGSILRLVILARFLSPSDFGVMAIVLMVLNVLDAFTTPGFNQALIQTQEDPNKYFASVFWVNILRAAILAPLIWMASPFIADFFHRPENAAIIATAALAITLRSLANPAMVLVHRDLDFKKVFFVDVSNSVASLLSALGLLMIMHNAWVLVLSTLFGELVAVIVSYGVRPWIPTMTLRVRDVLQLSQFGKWVVGSNIVVFLSLQIDNLVVARLLGAGQLGIYETSFRISNFPCRSSVPLQALSHFRL